MTKNKLPLSLAAAGLAMLCLLTACEEAPASSAVSVAAEPTAAPTEKSTPEPTPEPTATPEPTPEVNFAELFDAENPVDQQIEDNLLYASSTSAITQVYADANQRWEKVIDYTYRAALEVLPESDGKALTEEVDRWKDGLDAEKDRIYDGLGTDMDSQIRGAKELMAVYRDEASKVCEAYYRQTGEMPDFEEALADKAKG